MKRTLITGKTAEGREKTTIRDGHWKPETIKRLAARIGIVSDLSARHSEGDPTRPTEWTGTNVTLS